MKNKQLALILLIFTSFTVIFSSCNKHEDDITPYVNAYENIKNQISSNSDFTANISSENKYCTDSLQKASTKMEEIESFFLETNTNVEKAVNNNEIQEDDNKAKLETLKIEVQFQYDEQEQAFITKYNECFDAIMEDDQTILNETNEDIETLDNELEGIEGDMNSLNTLLGAKGENGQHVEAIQALDTRVKQIEDLRDEISNNLDILKNDIQFAQQSFEMGTFHPTEAQTETVNDLIEQVNASIVRSNEILDYIEQTLDPLGQEIADKILTRFNNIFIGINQSNQSIRTDLNGVQASINDFQTNGGDQSAIDSILGSLNIISTEISDNEEKINEVAIDVNKITSEMFGSSSQEALQQAQDDLEDNQGRHDTYYATASDFSPTAEILPVEQLIAEELEGGVVNITTSNNTLNVNTQGEWDNLNYNMNNNPEIIVNIDNGVTLTINANGITISGAQITSLSNFEGDIHLDMTNCFGATGTSSTLDHLNNLINFSSLDFSGVAIPQNPNNNSLGGINFSAGSFTLNRDLGHQLYSEIGTTTVSNGDWNGYFHTDVKDFESLNDAQVLPTNLVFKFGENITISNMQLITYYTEETSLFSFARTLSNSNLDYQSYGSNIHIPGGSFGENTNLIDGLTTAGNLVNPEEVEFLCSVIADNQGVDKGSFLSSTENTMHLLNIETVSTLENLGVEFSGAGHAIIYSNNSQPYNASSHFGLGGCYVMVEGGINCINTMLGGGLNFIYKGSGIDQNAAGLIITSTPEPEVDFTSLSGNPTLYMSDANVTFGTGTLDVADYSTIATNGEMILNENLSSDMGLPYGNVPVAPNMDVMNSELFYGLGGQTPWEIINSGSEDPLVEYYTGH